jgi:hypothetical protein
MKKNIYEIFEEFEKAPTIQDKANVLRFNDSMTLHSILRAAMHPHIHFYVDRVPNYKPSDAPIGLGYTTLHREISKIYLFEKNNPRRPPNLSEERMYQLLIQLLESLEAKEAVVFMNTLLKKLRIRDLDEAVIKMAFPEKWETILG